MCAPGPSLERASSRELWMTSSGKGQGQKVSMSTRLMQIP
jgi:hypothetical protein